MPAPANPADPKNTQQAAKKTKMGEAAAATFAPWGVAHDMQLAVADLRLDLDRCMGQIRRVDPMRVQELYEDLCTTPLTAMVRVTVWQTAVGGVPSTLAVHCSVS